MKLAGRLTRELAAAVELWLLPLCVALVPYRAGIALARLFASLPVYPQAAAAAHAHAVVLGGTDEAGKARWRREWRFHHLVDHADLYWTLTRPRSWPDRRLRGMPPIPPHGRPLVVVSFHYGQGMWLMRWLAAGGWRCRFLSIRPEREQAGSTLGYAYARLRNRAVESITGEALIYTGGARREIAASIAQGVAVFGLVDVPLADGAQHAGNATLLGHPVVLPTGLLESTPPDARALVITARAERDGTRTVEWSEAAAGSLSIDLLAGELATRLSRTAPAWHFWHLWPRFLARDASRPGAATPVGPGSIG